jgi:NitT/TauT family transport system substrate-binding protein
MDCSNPEETVVIISDKKYSSIEDKELAVKLIKSYEYHSSLSSSCCGNHVKEDVLYFVKELQT